MYLHAIKHGLYFIPDTILENYKLVLVFKLQLQDWKSRDVKVFGKQKRMIFLIQNASLILRIFT